MITEIRVPSPGESISEVEIARWLVENNTWVDKDQEVAEIESEKATLPLIASESGIISIKISAGTTVKVNEIACTIDSSGAKPLSNKVEPKLVKKDENPIIQKKEVETINSPEVTPAEPKTQNIKVTPLAEKIMKEEHISIEDILSGMKKITTHEVEMVKNQKKSSKPIVLVERGEERIKMSQLRKKLSERLVAVKNQTAMLTTFNEVDMSRVLDIRKNNQQAFQDKYGIKLGLMSFFTKATIEALKQHPLINSYIDNDEIVTPNFIDIGVAVQTPKGLMVPVLRNTASLSFAEIEKGITDLAAKGRSGRIGIDDLTGGTFTITNGGIFGSMLSTPILNPPQSGILGMHNIVDRPVAIDGKVEIRPIMYLAFSYDHRIIDGKDSVGFLLKIKQMIEKPELILFEGKNLDKELLGL
jgi:2-oxoglutarate dehydrogenase E2 component (dihydrolipoamide succinyltransferase)